MTMNVQPQGNQNQIDLSPKEAVLVTELLADKIRESKSNTFAQSDISGKLNACYNVIRRHREINVRVEEFKKRLGVKELSRELLLTAINNGQFPTNDEQFADAEKHYNRFFAVAGETVKKPRPARKSKTKTEVDPNEGKTAPNPA